MIFPHNIPAGRRCGSEESSTCVTDKHGTCGIRVAVILNDLIKVYPCDEQFNPWRENV
jgi:hypothetical protein